MLCLKTQPALAWHSNSNGQARSKGLQEAPHAVHA